MCSISIKGLDPLKNNAIKWSCSIIAIVILWFGLLLQAQAGLLTIKVDPGTSVTIIYDTDGDKEPDKKDGPQKDVDGDGKVSFGLGTLAEEAKIKKVRVKKESDKRDIIYELKLDADGVTVASLEPFDIPFFASDIPVYAYIDLAAYLAMSPLAQGDSFAVLNGGAVGLSAFLFKDATSLVGIPLSDFDESLISSLADYSGAITVSGFDNVAHVPESSSLILFISGLWLLGIKRLQIRKF